MFFIYVTYVLLILVLPNLALTNAPTTPPAASTTIPPPIENLEKYLWKPTSGSTIKFKVEAGYSISVTVYDVDIDGSVGNHLLISGTEDALSKNAFTYQVKKPWRFLFKTQLVVADFVIKSVTAGQNNTCKVLFEKTGEIIKTTTIPTTTDISFPPTESPNNVYILVNVSGKNYHDYQNSDVETNFRSCVSEMASNYCSVENILPTDKITKNNVRISNIFPCPTSWPHSNTCAQIRFRLPIFHNSTKWTGYQLNNSHLQIMWLRNAKYSQCLKKNGFSVYEEPSYNKTITWWAVGIVLTTIGFIALLIFLKVASSRLKAFKRKRKMSDTQSIISRDTSLISNSLEPHYLQDTHHA